MIKTLVQHGNSAALIIDKPILELLGLIWILRLKLPLTARALLFRRYQALIMRPDSRQLCSTLITSM